MKHACKRGTLAGDGLKAIRDAVRGLMPGWKLLALAAAAGDCWQGKAYDPQAATIGRA